MDLAFEEYQARRLVNVHKHVDTWFWDKYSASPYIGCRSGCEFCYLRGGYYGGNLKPETLDIFIRVKTNAVELLRKELAKLQPDVIHCGDWQQPAESRYQLSRQMLEVVYEFGFPLFVVERSPLLTRDLDLLTEINRKSWVGVALSISNLDPKLKQAFEPHSPGPGRRLQAMEQLAQAGIQVGTALMPILPLVGDDRVHLEEVIQATKDHGGSFILAGGMTVAGIQGQRTLAALRKIVPTVERHWTQLYDLEENPRTGSGPNQAYMTGLSRLVRELCGKYGLSDRMPRYVMPGRLAINKRVAERLALKVYDLELAGQTPHRIWAYRKAAWTVDEWPTSIADLYHERGEEGIAELPDIGRSLSREIAAWIAESP